MQYYFVVITAFLIIFAVIVYKHKQSLEHKQKQKESEAMGHQLKVEIYKKQEETREKQIFFEKYVENKHEPVKYLFYNTQQTLYWKFAHDWLWINEPFHSMFYELLMLFESNEFMIIDPKSKIITMHLREKHNSVQTSKSYQVYSTKNVIEFVIEECLSDLKNFYKEDAQNILISIYIIALQKSVHCFLPEIEKSTIDRLLKDYEYSEAIRDIVDLTKDTNSQFDFIAKAFSEAFRSLNTMPYNDSEIPKLLQLSQKLPKKLLQYL